MDVFPVIHAVDMKAIMHKRGRVNTLAHAGAECVAGLNVLRDMTPYTLVLLMNATLPTRVSMSYGRNCYCCCHYYD